METVTIWWMMLCGIAILNGGIWFYSAKRLEHQKPSMSAKTYRTRQWMLWLAFIYVIGCGFRSIFPVSDVPRIGVVDSLFTNIMLGRSVATVAELCFIAQCALLLNAIGKSMKVNLTIFLSQLLVPMIFVAELFSWYAVLTTNNLGHVFEESLWALSGTFLVVGLVALWPHASHKLRQFLLAGILFGSSYVAFMVLVDVPMYYERMQMDLALGKEYLSIGEGIWDTATRMTITTDLEIWRDEIPWITLYFSLAVWSSIALPHIPFGARRAEQRVRPTQRALAQSIHS